MNRCKMVCAARLLMAGMLLMAAPPRAARAQERAPVVPGADTADETASGEPAEGTAAAQTGGEDPGEEATEGPADDAQARASEPQPAVPELAPPPPREAPPPPPPVSPCSAHARPRALSAVVRVRSGSTWGAGYLYHSRRHVVTAFSLIRLGRGVSVVTADGAHHDAHVLGRDESADLVVLELDEPLEGDPLEPAPESSAMLGRPVIAMGHPFAGVRRLLGARGRGLLRWSVASGQVAAVNEAGIQADVALTPGHAGGPLLDCEGRALGMITGAGLLSPNIGLVVRSARVDAVIDGAGQPGDFIGALRPQFGIGGDLYIDEQGSVALGLDLTLGVTLFDRVSLMNRVGLFFGGLDSPMGEVLSRERQLIRIESLLGYRFFVDVFGFTTLYIVPAGGLAVLHDRRSERRAAVTPDCTATADLACITFEETVDEQWIARPALGLSFIFGGSLEIGYTMEIGVDTDPVVTYHVVRLGLIL